MKKGFGLIVLLGLSASMLHASFFTEAKAENAAEAYIKSNYDCIGDMDFTFASCNDDGCTVKVIAQRYQHKRNASGGTDFTRCDNSSETVPTSFILTLTSDGKRVTDSRVTSSSRVSSGASSDRKNSSVFDMGYELGRSIGYGSAVK